MRALRAYPRLRHGEHLRAWAYTIASRIAIDEHRRPRADAELPELASLDGAVITESAFMLRFFGENNDDRLLVVNLGARLHAERSLGTRIHRFRHLIRVRHFR